MLRIRDNNGNGESISTQYAEELPSQLQLDNLDGRSALPFLMKDSPREKISTNIRGLVEIYQFVSYTPCIAHQTRSLRPIIAPPVVRDIRTMQRQ